MCEWFCNVLENDENFLENVWFSDEAHFLLSGHVNSKNNVFWGSEVPDEVLQRPLHSVKCTAWVAMSKHGIIGPFWFEDDDGRSQDSQQGALHGCSEQVLGVARTPERGCESFTMVSARRSHTS